MNLQENINRIKQVMGIISEVVDLKAPNGQLSQLNSQQYHLVRSIPFKRFFGDWLNNPEGSSKVLDSNGEPRVVHHGTNFKFDKFDKNRLGEKNWMAKSANMGFFFAGNKETSKAYTGLNTMDYAGLGFRKDSDPLKVRVTKFEEKKKEIGSKIFPNIIKPLRDIFYGERIEEFQKAIEDKKKSNPELGYLFDDMLSKLYKDVENRNNQTIVDDYSGPQYKIQDKQELRDLIDKAISDSGMQQEIDKIDLIQKDIIIKMYSKEKGWNVNIMEVFLDIKNPYVVNQTGAEPGSYEISDYIQNAIEKKHDGVIFLNMADGGSEDDIFVVFESTQIKSATENKGSYNPEDDNMNL
jgi:hypothetical protein